MCLPSLIHSQPLIIAWTQAGDAKIYLIVRWKQVDGNSLITQDQSARFSRFECHPEAACQPMHFELDADKTSVAWSTSMIAMGWLKEESACWCNRKPSLLVLITMSENWWNAEDSGQCPRVHAISLSHLATLDSELHTCSSHKDGCFQSWHCWTTGMDHRILMKWKVEGVCVAKNSCLGPFISYS